MPDDTPKSIGDNSELAYAQALKYGRDLARLYTQEKEKRQELELANQQLQAIWATAPNGLAMLDQAMTIVKANPRFEALVEQQDGDCMGHPLTDVLPSEELVTALESASKASEEEIRFAEVEVTLKVPVKRNLIVIGAPLSVGDQRGWVISLHDLTERKRLEGLKEEFINVAAHELRTPLAIILGYTSILRDDLEISGDNMATTTIEAITQAGIRLKMVIDELVNFAAVKSRSADNVGIERFDLCKVIEQIVNSMQHLANTKEVNYTIELSPEPLMINGDRMILAQSIGQILENAINFNRPGGQVHIKATRSKGETIVEIADTGIGIPHADLDKIFDMFYQVEEHMTRARGGLGMGLSIARHGVELHTGRITAESTLGQGSRFCIILPDVTEQSAIPPELRLDLAHQQTLTYGHDLARAFADEQASARRLNRASELAHQLLARLELLAPGERTKEMQILLNEARTLTRRLVEETV